MKAFRSIYGNHKNLNQPSYGYPRFADQEILQNMKVYKNIRQMNPCILLMELSSIATLITVKISTYAGLRLTTRCIMYIFLNLPSIITCKWSLSWY